MRYKLSSGLAQMLPSETWLNHWAGLAAPSQNSLFESVSSLGQPVESGLVSSGQQHIDRLLKTLTVKWRTKCASHKANLSVGFLQFHTLSLLDQIFSGHSGLCSELSLIDHNAQFLNKQVLKTVGADDFTVFIEAGVGLIYFYKQHPWKPGSC